MGGYGLYVWSSFAFCLLVGGYQTLKPLLDYGQTVQRLRRDWQEEAFK